MTKKQPRAVLYVRVSTESQAEKGTSLSTQAEECRKKAIQIGAEIVAVFEDAGVSGTLFATRLGLQDAIAMIESGQADTLIAYDMTRLSRKVEHQCQIDERLSNAGARVLFCTQSFDETPEGDLAKGIMGGFAEYERKKIKERTTKGRRRRAEEGLQPIRNFSPFGYHIVTEADALSGSYPAAMIGTYQINEKQARWAKKIFEQFARGKSLRLICKMLEENGVPKPRNGAFWRPDVIKKMIENPVYKGSPIFGRHERKTDESLIAQGRKHPFITRRASKDKWVRLSCEPLVEENLWELCNQRLKDSRAIHGGNPQNKYTLTGIIRCPLCQRSMRAQRWKNKTPNAEGSLMGHSYHCPHAYPSRNSAGKVCNSHKYHGATMDSLTCRAVEEAINTPEAIEAAMLTYEQSQQTGDDENLISEINEQLKSLTQREKATVKAQIVGIESGASNVHYAEAFQAIYRERTGLQEQLQEIEKRHSGESKAKIISTAERINEILGQVKDVLFAPEITPAERQNLLSLVVRQVIPHKDGALVYLRSPIAGAESTVANVPALAK